MLVQNILSFEDFNNYLDKNKYIILNVGAKWCKPCVALKPQLEKFVNVIDKFEFIYLKLDYGIFEEEQEEFSKILNINKIPLTIFIVNGNVEESIISSDFSIVSKKIFEFINKYKEENFSNTQEF